MFGALDLKGAYYFQVSERTQNVGFSTLGWVAGPSSPLGGPSVRGLFLQQLTEPLQSLTNK